MNLKNDKITNNSRTIDEIFVDNILEKIIILLNINPQHL